MNKQNMIDYCALCFEDQSVLLSVNWRLLLFDWSAVCFIPIVVDQRQDLVQTEIKNQILIIVV